MMDDYENLFRKRQDGKLVRNPKRVPHMINLMHMAWAQEDNVDMRMGQLLMNAARLGGWSNDDLWNCEDEIFAKGFLMMINLDKKE